MNHNNSLSAQPDIVPSLFPKTAEGSDVSRYAFAPQPMFAKASDFGMASNDLSQAIANSPVKGVVRNISDETLVALGDLNKDGSLKHSTGYITVKGINQ